MRHLSSEGQFRKPQACSCGQRCLLGVWVEHWGALLDQLCHCPLSCPHHLWKQKQTPKSASVRGSDCPGIGVPRHTENSVCSSHFAQPCTAPTPEAGLATQHLLRMSVTPDGRAMSGERVYRAWEAWFSPAFLDEDKFGWKEHELRLVGCEMLCLVLGQMFQDPE